MADRREIERSFARDELFDSEVYRRLSLDEDDLEVRSLLLKLSETEARHAKAWIALSGGKGVGAGTHLLAELRILEMLIARRLLGVAFVVKFLERHERQDIGRYRAALESQRLSDTDRKEINVVVKVEAEYERRFTRQADAYRGDLDHMQAIILGLNDGLVEVLAIISGIAMIATSSAVVVIIGLFAGVSGTLSMSGGMYLSEKSKSLLERGKSRVTSPEREAYYTGIWYFAGALLTVMPFIAGFSGLSGVAVSILLATFALVVVSSVIAVMSGTSIRKRASEMLAISLGAALFTVLLGAVAKAYFGVSI